MVPDVIQEWKEFFAADWICWTVLDPIQKGSVKMLIIIL